MNKEFNTSITKYQEDDKGTIYKDISILDIIEKEICICDNTDTIHYHAVSTQEFVSSWCEKETKEKIVREKFFITEMEQWNGEVISMDEDSFDAILSLQGCSNNRLVKIKKSAVNPHDWKNMHEGSQLVWNFKTERTAKGTIRKNNQIFLKNELKMNMSDIQNLVEEEMKKFSNLFSDD